MKNSDGSDASGSKKSGGRKVKKPEAPLLQGEGKRLKVLGFSQQQRSAFLKLLNNYGLHPETPWKLLTARRRGALKTKTEDEIKRYGMLVLKHLSEPEDEKENFKDGVPKEGLKYDAILARLGSLRAIFDKCENDLKEPGSVLNIRNISGTALSKEWATKCPWGREMDKKLLIALNRHGYGRWAEIMGDKELKLKPVAIEQIKYKMPSRRVQKPKETQPVIDLTSDGSNGTTDTNKNAGKPGKGKKSKGGDEDNEISNLRINKFIKKRVTLLEEALSREAQLIALEGLPSSTPSSPSFDAAELKEEGDDEADKTEEVKKKPSSVSSLLN